MADAANQLIAELIGEAFIDAIRTSRHRAAVRARGAWRWLRGAFGAPPDMELVARDGSRYTGIVVVDHSRAVVLVALRHAWDVDADFEAFGASDTVLSPPLSDNGG